MQDRQVSLADRIYASLIRLFPGDFRSEFAQEMLADFRDQRTHAAATGGRPAVAVLWIRTALDILRRAPAEQLDVTRRDAAYALRMIRRHPLFAAAAISTLALAIGVNTTIFGIVDGMLFKPMPYHEPGRLVMLSSYQLGGDYPSALISIRLAVTLRERHSGLVDLATVGRIAPMTLVENAEPVSLSGIWATTNLLDVLGVAPVRGRSFIENDANAVEPAALLSHAAWRLKFGADPSVIDRVIRLEDRRIRIVGVLPRTFVVPSLDAKNADLLIAFESPFQGPVEDSGLSTLPAIARLKPNVTLSAAQAEADALVANLVDVYPEDFAIRGRSPLRARLMKLQVGLFESRRSALWSLLGAAALVLVIACANLANLLLARAAKRQREMAVRSALGASRVRLVRQLAIESAVLALAGGTVGVVLALLSFNLALQTIPPAFALLLPESMDLRAAGFAGIVTGVSVLVFGTIPALRSSQTDLLTGLHDRHRVPVFKRVRDGHLLLAGETLIVTVLVISAVLMVGSFVRLRGSTLGFESSNLLSIELTTRVVQGERMRQVLSQVAHEMQRIPGVVSVAAEDTSPIGGFGWSSGQARLPDRRVVSAHRVSANYIETMGLRLVAGRLPADAEWRDPFPAVITERVALMLGGSQSALGAQLVLSSVDNRATVVGVVSDIRFRYDDIQPRQVVFVPPLPDRWTAPGLIVRTSGHHTGLDHQIRAILKRVMPRAVPEIVPVTTQLDGSLALSRFHAQLFGTFALLAVLLAVVGIYGVLAQMVAARTREIGICLALGASTRSVRRLIIAQGVAPVIAGLILGVIAGYWTVQVFRRYVHGVDLRDPLFFITAAVIVMSAALAATWIPARRATRIDPVATLKTD